jgi:hypothetical protein
MNAPFSVPFSLMAEFMSKLPNFGLTTSPWTPIAAFLRV